MILSESIHIAILTYNALEDTQVCLRSLLENTRVPYRVWIFDNASKDDSRSWLQEFAASHSQIHVEFSDINLGVPGGRNRLLKTIVPIVGENSFIVFMDNDIEVLPGWEYTFLDFFSDHPEVGIASAAGHTFTVYEQGRVLDPQVQLPAPVDVACGGFACWVRKAVVDAVGEFDEKLGIFWHEDDDYSVRALAAGYEVYQLPQAQLIHHEHKSGVADSNSIKNDGSPKNQRYLIDKWRKEGWVDEQGYICRPKFERYEPKHHFQDLRVDGFSRNMGGFYFVSPQAEIRTFHGAKISFTISIPDYADIPVFPFKIEFKTCSRLLCNIKVIEANELHEVCLELSPEEDTVFIECSASFSPFCEGVLFSEQSHYSFLITRPIITKSHDNSGSVIEISTKTEIKKQKIQVGFCGRFLETSTSSTLLRDLVEYGVTKYTQDKQPLVNAFRQDMFELLRLRTSPPSLLYWQNFLGSETTSVCFVGTVREFLSTKFQASTIYALVICNQPDGDSLIEYCQRLGTRLHTLWIFGDCQLFSLHQPTKVFQSRLIKYPASSITTNKQYDACLVLDWSDHRSLWREYLEVLIGNRDCKKIILHELNWTRRNIILDDFIKELLKRHSSTIELEMSPGIASLQSRLDVFAQCRHCVIPSNNFTQYLAEIALFQSLQVPVVFHDNEQLNIYSRAGLTPHTPTSYVRFLQDEQLEQTGNTSGDVDIAVELEEILNCILKNEGEKQKTYIESLDTRVRVGIDARTLHAEQNIVRGIGEYTAQHLLAMSQHLPSWQFILLSNETISGPWSNSHNIDVATFQDATTFDLYHIPDPISTVDSDKSPFDLLPPNTPASCILYDFTPLTLKEILYDKWTVQQQNVYKDRLSAIANIPELTCLSISENTRRDAMHYIGLEGERIQSIFAGVHTSTLATEELEILANGLLKKYGIKDKYFLFVGSPDPHKNFDVVLKAHAAVRMEQAVSIVITGRANAAYKQHYEMLCKQHSIEDVVFTGFLERVELDALYTKAQSLLFPSLYEGFGFPVVEAFAHGCPVVASNRGSIPEIAGDSAILLEPDNSTAFFQAMRNILYSSDLRDELAFKGRERSEHYSWKHTAQLTAEVWQNMIALRRLERKSDH